MPCTKEAGGKKLRREGQADDVALHLFTPLACEECLLRRSLHAFGDDGELHAVAEGDDGAHDGCIVRVVGQAAHEGLVDFEEVQGQAFEVAEGRVAGAEIIDRQLDAQALELVQHRERFFGLAHDEVFGDFQLQAAGFEAVIVQQLFDA